jgi:N-acetylmuramoyl-L-alanine amidase
MTLRIVECRSPNHDARPDGGAVDMLVLHYTGMKTAEEALARLTDPAAKVSAHYTIDRDGRVYHHVPEERRAWHAGVSYWAGERNVNARSIGIELVNPGHEFGYLPFPPEQIEALIDLSSGILSRHPIPAPRVVAHSDVAPARKMDPGELFPWKQLSEFGIGAYPPPIHSAAARRNESASPSRGEAKFAQELARFGYGVPPAVDTPLKDVVTAFQRHFRPSCIDGVADAECAGLLAGLLAR